MSESRVGEDLFGSFTSDTEDDARAGEAAIRGDRVGRAAGGVAPGALDGRPLHGEFIAVDDADALLDGAGDEPLNQHLVGSVTVADDNNTGVLAAQRVDAIHDVGADKARAIGHGGTGDGAGGEYQSEQKREESLHEQADSTELHLPRWVRWSGVALAAFTFGAIAFAIFEPIQVLPRIRLAPGYSMVDQSGDVFSSEDARGQVTLYTFGYGDCGSECAWIDETMSTVADRVTEEVDLGGADFGLVTVSLDPNTDSDRLSEIAAASGADGDRWRWGIVDEGSIGAVVGSGFEVYFDRTVSGDIQFDPTFVLVDGWGVIRGEYQYATLAGDADKIVRHIGVLAEELRNSDGLVSVAYEAAHVFLCYP